MPAHCFMSVIWGMDHVWQGWITPHTIVWPHNTPWVYSAATLVFRNKSLINVHHQSCGGPRKMIHVWICYPTVLWVSYEALTTSDMCGPPHIPQHDHKLHAGHALLHWLLDPRAWTMHITSGAVVRGKWYMYGYANPLFYECNITLIEQCDMLTVGTPLFYECYITLIEQWGSISIHAS